MFEDILSRIGAVLEGLDIPYMIIGGQAVLLHGEPRLTRDIDITLGLDAGQLDVVLQGAEELCLEPLPRDIREFVANTMVLPCLHKDTGIRVDFIFSFTPYEIQAIARAQHVMIKGIPVRFASVEDLIIHKVFAGRPRDLEDVRSIVIRNPQMDMAYIRQWLEQFDGVAGENDFLHKFQSIIDNVHNHR